MAAQLLLQLHQLFQLFLLFQLNLHLWLSLFLGCLFLNLCQLSLPMLLCKWLPVEVSHRHLQAAIASCF